MEKDRPVAVFAGETIDADLVRSVLEADGIKSALADEFMGGITAFVTPGGSGAVKVLVREEDYDRARYLTQKFLDSRLMY